MQMITKWSEVPSFEEEKDENAFWMAHQLDTRLINAAVVKSDVRESTTITLRFDPRMLARIKRLARTRFLNYQSMMKQWLSERLENEMKNLS